VKSLRRAGGRAGLLVLVVTLALGGYADGRSLHLPPDSDWCGNPSSDWICHYRGTIWVADSASGALAPDQVLASGAKRHIGSEGTRITTGPNAVARVRYKSRAKCSLGGNGQVGQFFTRPDEELLFRQSAGYSSCSTFRRHPAEANILCSPEEKCPATLKATGTFFVKTFAPEASASSTETFVRRARIVVCAGSIQVRAESEGSFAEAAGGASGGNRFVVLVEEVSSTTVDESAGENKTETVHKVNVNVVGHPLGPGGCAASLIEEQEHTFTP
jgi:hypothetical protein